MRPSQSGHSYSVGFSHTGTRNFCSASSKKIKILNHSDTWTGVITESCVVPELGQTVKCTCKETDNSVRHLYFGICSKYQTYFISLQEVLSIYTITIYCPGLSILHNKSLIYIVYTWLVILQQNDVQVRSTYTEQTVIY